MKFNEKLICLRKRAGFSQEDLAEKLGVSRQAVSRWEAGSTLPDAVNLLGLSDLFCVSVDNLLRDELPLDASTETVGQVPDPAAPVVPAQEPPPEPQQTEAPVPPAPADRRKRTAYILLCAGCLAGGLFFLMVGLGLRFLVGIGFKLMGLLLLPMAACLFGAGFFAVKAAKQTAGRSSAALSPQAFRRKRDELLAALVIFFLAGVLFLCSGWIFWNYVVGALWLMWLTLVAGAACLFAAGFCGFRLYILTHSQTEEERTKAQANLALVTAVLNMVSGICFSFAGGLSGIWLYWVAAALLIVSAIGEYARWQRLKYGDKEE